MRLRRRLVLTLAGAHLALTAAIGTTAWAWQEARLRAQARAAAASVAEVLAAGGFTRNAEVLARMRALVGRELRLAAPGSPIGDDEVAAAAGSELVVVAVRTPGHDLARRDLLLATAGGAVAGIALFLLIAWLVSRRFAAPVERLALEAGRLGEGDWDEPVAAGGDDELRRLGAALDTMRRRLVGLDAQRRAGERLAAIGTYAATIAHEVRNPLSSIRLAAQMLPAGRDDAAVALILDEIERLDLVIDELLGTAKGMTVQPEPVAVRPLAEGIVRLLRRQADHAGIALAVHGETRLTADPRRLRQVLLNLVLNAIQACQRGGGSTVAIELLADGFAVRDDGPGIPPDQAAHLFTAFASGRSDGTGLGLHLAAAVATAHGARLRHEPASPRGARFILDRLPAG